uniref:GyrI-like domain-containing protein n=1 Tax=Blautia faecicola TaxID=2509240 RepID=UPI003522B830
MDSIACQGRPVHSEQHNSHKPAGTYAVIYLKGDYYEADQDFQTLLKYIRENNLTPGAYCYKEAVPDEMALEHETQLVTRISIPV